MHDTKHLSNPEYSNFIALSRYARWLPDAVRRETWDETVQRYTGFWETNGRLAHEEACHMGHAIRTMEAMPSMRLLMTAGDAVSRSNVAAFNCSYVAVDHPFVFDEILYVLMNGTGVGFSCERQYVSQLPPIPATIEPTGTTVVVDDSKEGWAAALRDQIAMLYAGKAPRWDVSKVRPAGAPLKTFGGRASGPGPLVSLFQYTEAAFRKAAGRKLNSLEVHGLVCKIAEVVVVGGVRRSALISLSNLSDQRMRHAKSGQWWVEHPEFSIANNSIAYTEKPDGESFMREWLALVESKSGERGIFNRVAAQVQAAKNGRRDPDHEFGTNPCCVSGETEILTSTGYKRIDDTVGVPTVIWNGSEWAEVTPYAAGEAELYRVTLTDGTYLDCTANHRWVIEGKGFVQTKDLCIDDPLMKHTMPVIDIQTDDGLDASAAYSQGFYSGDGNKGYKHSWVYEPKFPCVPRLVGSFHDEPAYKRKRWSHGVLLDKSFVPVNAPIAYKMDWLSGLLDADGCVTYDKNGSGFQVTSIDHQFLLDVRLMLTTVGVQAKVVNAAHAGYKSMPNGRGEHADYHTKETKRLLIGNTDAHHLMGLGLRLERLVHDGGKPQRDARRFVRVVSVVNLDWFDMTYCFTEPKSSKGTFNGIVTGNSEIILRSKQFCNLSEVVIRADDTEDTLSNKIVHATVMGTLQATLTDFPYLRPEWSANTAEEALLGVSLTGIMDNNLMNDPDDPELPARLERLKQVAVDTNAAWAERLGINQSAAITCVKPSGTVSQLVDSASGIHPRYAPYYIRTVRADNKDPLAKMMQDAGFPCEPDVMKPDTTLVFSFPMKAPNGAVFRDDRSAIDQLRLWLIYQRHWCEHKPSVTVYVRDHEWMEVGAWVYKHFDEVSGVSFLPHSDHTYQQAPYQEITEEQYHAAVASMPVGVDWSAISQYETEDRTAGSKTMACTAGVCEVVDLT